MDKIPEDGQAHKPRDAAFAFLPTDLLKAPPIRHRGDASDTGLGVFEFAVMTACVVAARVDGYAQARHRHAMRVGKNHIRESEDCKYPDKYLNRMKIGNTNYEFYLAGKVGYMNGHDAFSAADDAAYTVKLSASALLRMAGASRGGKAQHELPGALERLTRPVADRKPVLRSWRTMPDGLELVVDGDWVPTGRYSALPLPLPMKGATTLALYLFLHGINTASSEERSIRLTALCQRLHIPSAHGRRALKAAITVVNKHMARLPRARLQKARRDFPASFTMKTFRGGWVRFVAQYDNRPDDVDDVGVVKVRQRKMPEREATPSAANGKSPVERWRPPTDEATFTVSRLIAQRDAELMTRAIRNIEGTSTAEWRKPTMSEAKARAICSGW